MAVPYVRLYRGTDHPHERDKHILELCNVSLQVPEHVYTLLTQCMDIQNDIRYRLNFTLRPKHNVMWMSKHISTEVALDEMEIPEWLYEHVTYLGGYIPNQYTHYELYNWEFRKEIEPDESLVHKLYPFLTCYNRCFVDKNPIVGVYREYLMCDDFDVGRVQIPI